MFYDVTWHILYSFLCLFDIPGSILKFEQNARYANFLIFLVIL